MNIVVEAPKDYPKTLYTIFLAGSIEVGKAEEWQTKLINSIVSPDNELVLILNPRRKDWIVHGYNQLIILNLMNKLCGKKKD